MAALHVLFDAVTAGGGLSSGMGEAQAEYPLLLLLLLLLLAEPTSSIPDDEVGRGLTLACPPDICDMTPSASL